VLTNSGVPQRSIAQSRSWPQFSFDRVYLMPSDVLLLLRTFDLVTTVSQFEKKYTNCFYVWGGGRWNRETWHRETWQRGTRLNRSQLPNIRRPRKNRTCWIKSCLSRFDSGAYSRLQFLRAVIRSPYTPAGRQQQQQQQQRWRRRGQAGPRASSDNFRGVRIGNGSRGNNLGRLLGSVPRAGFALVPCGHRTRRQYTRRRYDDQENF